MPRGRFATCLTVVAAVSIAAACRNTTTPDATGGGGTQSSSGFLPGMLSLRASPVDPGAILWITPLGNLNPPSHTLPTDHIYFYIANPDAGDSPVAKRTPFAAPGDGTVGTVIGGVGLESKVFVRQTTTFGYYLDHLILTTPLSAGSKVTAGQVLGTTGSAYAIDLGVTNDALTLSFVSPERYNSDTRHADAPLKYFDEPLRTQLYAKVQRLGSDLDGRIDFDVAGRLIGNWFVGSGDSTPLVFTYDTYDPSKVLIAINTGSLQGVFSIGATDPAPKDVTVASGRVLYTLTRTNSGPPHNNTGISGFLLVQLLDDSHVREEIFPPPAVPADFTGGSRTFSR